MASRVQARPKLKSIVVVPNRGTPEPSFPAASRAPIATRLVFPESSSAPPSAGGRNGTDAHAWETYRSKRQRKEAAKQRSSSQRVSVFRRLGPVPPRRRLQNPSKPCFASAPPAAASSASPQITRYASAGTLRGASPAFVPATVRDTARLPRANLHRHHPHLQAHHNPKPNPTGRLHRHPHSRWRSSCRCCRVLPCRPSLSTLRTALPSS